MSLAEPEDRNPYLTVGMLCRLRYEGKHSDEEIARKLGFDSIENMRIQLESWMLAERTGDTLLARAAYHRAIDLGVQPVVDSYLEGRPKEAQAWQRYTEAAEEVRESRDVMHVLARGLTERALSSDPAGVGA